MEKKNGLPKYYLCNMVVHNFEVYKFRAKTPPTILYDSTKK